MGGREDRCGNVLICRGVAWTSSGGECGEASPLCVQPYQASRGDLQMQLG